MPRFIGDTVDNFGQFIARLDRLEHRLDAQAALQTMYLTKGNSYYVLDDNANCVAILGDISTAPQGVGGTQTNTSTGLTGRGIAVYNGSSWVQVT